MGKPRRFHASSEHHAAARRHRKPRRRATQTLLQRELGFLSASIFSLSYYFVPAYLVFTAQQVYQAPTSSTTLLLLLPILISILLPPLPSSSILQSAPFQCIPDYFDFQEAMEIDSKKLDELVSQRPTLICLHPHGVFSMVALCAAVKWSKTWWSPRDTPTAVADSVLNTPLLKHVIGILGLTSATSRLLDAALQKKRGVILYPGGTSELFLTDPDEERLHLLDRKGFVRVALRNGAALVPGYLFGNTHVLRPVRTAWLRAFSRKTGFALTYFYGRFFLPMPFPASCMCVIGRPILLPKLEQPTKEEVDEWHAVYVQELRRIFNEHKHKVPGYENKELIIE